LNYNFCYLIEAMRLQFHVILFTNGIGETTSSVSLDLILREAYIYFILYLVCVMWLVELGFLDFYKN
jgi:hypothetical protein